MVAGECQLAKNTQKRAQFSIRIHKHNNDMIYLLAAIGLSPGGSTHLHTNNT